MMIKCLVWNIRGVAKANASDRLKNLIRCHKLVCFGILEPMVSVTNNDIYLKKFNSFLSFTNCNNKVWFFWKECLKFDVLIDHPQFLHMKVHYNNESFFFTLIYAGCTKQDRKELWDLLKDINPCNEAWLLGGDFNVIASPSEKKGGIPPNLNIIDGFNNLLNTAGLFDLGYSGDPFTWYRGKTFERLDRFVANVN